MDLSTLHNAPSNPDLNSRMKSFSPSWKEHSGGVLAVTGQRVTVYGAIIVYPKPENAYPFPQLDDEVPIILGR